MTANSGYSVTAEKWSHCPKGKEQVTLQPRFSWVIGDMGCGLSETQTLITVPPSPFLTSWSKRIFGYYEVSVSMTE